MDSDKIIIKMMNIAEKHNMAALKNMGYDEFTVKKISNDTRPQLYKIQKEILETLVEDGIVSLNQK